MAKRHGPVPRPAADKRSIRISVFLTENEKITLLEKAGAMLLPDYLRHIGMGQRPPRPIPTLHIQLWRDLARVGANLNQIAWHLNIGDQIELCELRDVISKLHHKLDDVRNILI